MNDDLEIKNTIQYYIDVAKSGKGNDMKSAFHEDATIFRYIGKLLTKFFIYITNNLE